MMFLSFYDFAGVRKLCLSDVLYVAVFRFYACMSILFCLMQIDVIDLA